MANPRAEAEDMLGGDYEARVLEPSPPSAGPPDYADDPIEPGEVPEGRELVSPVRNRGDLTWEDVVTQEPDLAPWCAERWLAAWRRLEPLPESFDQTRAALHEVAEGVVAPARKPENEISLRWTRGGFGTPFFEQDGEDRQVRVEGAELVRQAGTTETREPLPAQVDETAALALGDLYGFACSVLEQLRADELETDGSWVRLWPEHFDIAVELGEESAGRRASFGASPGDENHAEPYLYVSPWTAEVSGELWNASGFRGAELGYSELIAAEDQRRTALEFFDRRYRALQEADG
jgi:hypothetical protein